MILKNSFLNDLVFDAVLDDQTGITCVTGANTTFIVQQRQKKGLRIC